jgi:hypothetical protein
MSSERDVHPSVEELVDYLSARLPEAGERPIEEHLAVCAGCTERGRRIHAAMMQLASLGARAHGQAPWQANVIEALAGLEAAKVPRAWRERLTKWRERWAGLAEGAVLVVVGARDGASRLVGDGLDALLRPGAGWQIAPAPLPLPTRGAPGPGHEATEAPIPTMEASLGPGGTRARIALGKATRELVVRVDRLPAGIPPPLIILVPQDSGMASRIAEPARQPGTDYHVARFTDLPAGQYFAFFEPTEA